MVVNHWANLSCTVASGWLCLVSHCRLCYLRLAVRSVVCIVYLQSDTKSGTHTRLTLHFFCVTLYSLATVIAYAAMIPCSFCSRVTSERWVDIRHAADSKPRLCNWSTQSWCDLLLHRAVIPRQCRLCWRPGFLSHSLSPRYNRLKFDSTIQYLQTMSSMGGPQPPTRGPTFHISIAPAIQAVQSTDSRFGHTVATARQWLLASLTGC